MNRSHGRLVAAVFALSLAAGGCASRGGTQAGVPPTGAGSTAPATTASSAPSRNAHETLNGYLWVQTSAEFHALAASLYRGAQTTLEQALGDASWTAIPEQTPGQPLPAAVVMDLDETVLDNSAAQGQFILDGTPYVSATWRAWVDTASAPALPGAQEFIRFAEARGVKVFYVTNRTAAEQPKTLENLASIGIAASDETVMCVGENGWTSDKTARRLEVAKTHRVLLLVGDDMNDFVSTASLTPAQRVALAQQHAARWGTRWILLPNPQYGTWERALYPGVTEDGAVLERKREHVRGFRKP
jgi:acid phosphatase